ncbi:MAG: PKD domain-containing protein [Dysgonamonadaceae bacterium]|nr:PKD domain-containing protein [Dysgonamonadaceae bacterium]
MSFYCVQAQVIIGANRTPHPGAILELESNDNYGFLLPKVSLTSIASWGLTGSAVEGMLVFNESVTFANGLNGKGIYIWLNDAKWHLAQGIFSDMPLTLENIALSPSETIGKNKIFTASVPAIPGAQYYEWDIPTGLLGFSNTNVISLVGINAGAYTIRVKAINSQGTGTYQTKSVTVTN